LKVADYWVLPPGQVPVGARDGALWIVESQHGAKCHVVLRWSLEDGPLRDSALLLIKFSGEEVGYVY
jgi:hypothetical protein